MQSKGTHHQPTRAVSVRRLSRSQVPVAGDTPTGFRGGLVCQGQLT